MMEKDKLHAKKQALQKKEKDGRLAELKMFHQTFKLNVPIPADLVPLLSKGKKSTDNESSPEQKTPLTATKKSVASSTTPAAVTKPVASSPATPPATITKAQPSPVTAASTSPVTPSSNTAANAFKFNVKASSFKPNPTAAAFVPGGGLDKSNARQAAKKGDPSEHLTMTEAFSPTFVDNPSAVGPTWPFGNKSYRVQFNQFSGYEEDMYGNYPSPQYGYGYPQYRYPQYIQGMPPMAVQQGPYMNPQFVQNIPAPMPPNGGPPAGYSPQMANVSPHGSPFPQGYPSPQRAAMVPQGMPPPPHGVYQYQGGPMMMRYPQEMMQQNNNGPPPNMMQQQQRPVMVEPMQYSPHHPPQHDSPGRME